MQIKFLGKLNDCIKKTSTCKSNLLYKDLVFESELSPTDFVRQKKYKNGNYIALEPDEAEELIPDLILYNSFLNFKSEEILIRKFREYNRSFWLNVENLKTEDYPHYDVKFFNEVALRDTSFIPLKVKLISPFTYNSVKEFYRFSEINKMFYIAYLEEILYEEPFTRFLFKNTDYYHLYKARECSKFSTYFPLSTEELEKNKEVFLPKIRDLKKFISDTSLGVFEFLPYKRNGVEVFIVGDCIFSGFNLKKSNITFSLRNYEGGVIETSQFYNFLEDLKSFLKINEYQFTILQNCGSNYFIKISCPDEVEINIISNSFNDVIKSLDPTNRVQYDGKDLVYTSSFLISLLSKVVITKNDIFLPDGYFLFKF